MSVTFTCRRISDRRQDLRCNETGVHYQIDRTTRGYVVYNSGVVVAFRAERPDAIKFIEQLAELDFRVAQSDSAFVGNC